MEPGHPYGGAVDLLPAPVAFGQIRGVVNTFTVVRKDPPLFSATTSTTPRRILARAVVAGVIAAAPLTVSSIPASAESATSVAVGTEIGHGHIGQDRPGFRGNDHGNNRGNDWWGDRDRGRGNDPLWRLFRGLIPGGMFGSG